MADKSVVILEQILDQVGEMLNYVEMGEQIDDEHIEKLSEISGNLAGVYGEFFDGNEPYEDDEAEEGDDDEEDDSEGGSESKGTYKEAFEAKKGLMTFLEAKRGRPKGSTKSSKEEPKQAIQEPISVQLQNRTNNALVSVHFNDGSTHEIPREHANKALSMLNSLKPVPRGHAHDMMSKSKEHFYNVLKGHSFAPVAKPRVTLGSMRKEEVELDEISKNLAAKAVHGFANRMDDAYYKGDRKAFSRAQNARNLAIAKHSGAPTAKVPAKEEVELDEAGAFSYGYKPPRKGSSAYEAMMMRKQQEKNKKPIEPKDQMVGNAKVTKEEVKLDETKLPPHLAKLFNNKGDFKDPEKQKIYNNMLKREMDKRKLPSKSKIKEEVELDEQGTKGPFRHRTISSKDVASAADKGDKALDKNYRYGTTKGGVSPIAGKRREQGFGAMANFNSANAAITSKNKGESPRAQDSAVHKGWGKTVDQMKAPNPEKQAAREKLKRTAFSALPKGKQEKDTVLRKGITAKEEIELEEGFSISNHPVHGKILHKDGKPFLGSYDQADAHAAKHKGTLIKSMNPKKYMVKMPEHKPAGNIEEKTKIPHILDPMKSLKHAVKDAKANYDYDFDGDVDSLDKKKMVPADSSEVNPKTYLKKYALEKKHTKGGVAYEQYDKSNLKESNLDIVNKAVQYIKAKKD